jgi:hypothetical protein
MKKNSKNSKNLSASVQPQLSQQQATPLSTLTMDELESVQGGMVSLPDFLDYWDRPDIIEEVLLY